MYEYMIYYSVYHKWFIHRRVRNCLFKPWKILMQNKNNSVWKCCEIIIMHYTLYWKNLGIKTSLKIMHIIRSYDEKTFDLHSGTNWFWWSWIENEFSRVLYFISNSITAPAIFCLGVTLKGFIESTSVTFWQIFLWRELEMVGNSLDLQFFQMKYKRYFSQQ